MPDPRTAPELDGRHQPDHEPGAREEPGRRDSEPQVVGAPSVIPGGVELTRLMARARLTPAQSLELAAGLSGEAVRRSRPGDGEPGGADVVLAPVVIGTDGRVVSGPDAEDRPDGGSPVAGRTLGAVLADIAETARPRARAAGPAAGQLLAAVDRAVAELPEAGVPAVARSLGEAATALDRRAVRAEIGALVRAIVPDAGSAPAGVPHPAPRTAPDRSSLRGHGSSARRRAAAWALSVLLLAGAVLLEVAFLRDRVTADIGVLLDAGRSGSAASTTPKPDGRPVAAPAPAAAGPVAAVDLRALSSCAPGSPCAVRLEVRLVPGAGQQVVAWSYRVVDRCTGAVGSAPGGSVTVPAGADRAAVVVTVALPAGDGVAVLAVTRTPAVAASSPVIAGSCRSHP